MKNTKFVAYLSEDRYPGEHLLALTLVHDKIKYKLFCKLDAESSKLESSTAEKVETDFGILSGFSTSFPIYSKLSPKDIIEYIGDAGENKDGTSFFFLNAETPLLASLTIKA